MVYKNPRFEVLFKKNEVWHRRNVVTLAWTGGMPLATFALGEGDAQPEGQTTAQVLVDFLSSFLFENTGMFDRAGAEIMHGDICVDEQGDLYKIVYYWGSFRAQKGEEEGITLDDVFCCTLKVVGDIISNQKLLIPNEIPEIVRQADARQNGTIVGNEVKKPVVLTDFKR